MAIQNAGVRAESLTTILRWVRNLAAAPSLEGFPLFFVPVAPFPMRALVSPSILP